jgi:HEPN domain-containing protein
VSLLLLLNSASRYEEVLLETARTAISRGKPGDYEVAVVTSQMAVEITVEQVIAECLSRKNVPELEEPLGSLLSSLTALRTSECSSCTSP